MERSEDDQIAFTWRQFYSEDQDIPEQLNFFAMVKVSQRSKVTGYGSGVFSQELCF